MPVSQMREAMAAERLDPFLEERVQFMLAQLTAAVLNRFRMDKKEEPFKPEDFIPDWGITPEELQARKARKIRDKLKMQQLRRELLG